MGSIIKRWSEWEPARLYGYSIGLAVVSLLALYGLINGELIPAYLALLAAVLEVPAVEGIRASVWPKGRIAQIESEYIAEAEFVSYEDYEDLPEVVEVNVDAEGNVERG